MKQITPTATNDIKLMGDKLTRLAIIKDKSIRQIAKETGFAINTVRSALNGIASNISVFAAIAENLDISLLDLHTVV